MKKLSKYIIIGLLVGICITATHVLFLEPLIRRLSLVQNNNVEFDMVVSKVENELRMRGLQFDSAEVYLTEMVDFPSAVGITYTIPIEIGFTKSWIEIKKGYFNDSSDEIREALILHEYGHYLGANHDSAMRKFRQYSYFSGYESCPATVMHPTDSLMGCFNSHRQYYYDDLVKRVLEK